MIVNRLGENMDSNYKAKQLLKIYKEILLNSFFKTDHETFNVENFFSYLSNNNIILDAEIKKEIIEYLKNKRYFLLQTKSIIELLYKHFKKDSIEHIINEDEPLIYIHTQNKHSYLINYDSIEQKWYLALIETSSYALIKEIYAGPYKEFILYLKKVIE